MTENPAPRLELVVPVFNEQETIEVSIRALHASLGELFPDDDWLITIADNASTDATPVLADYLADRLDGVHALHLTEKGRGRALKQAWLASDADVVAYVDVDLSTDLRALPPLVSPLLSGHSDIAIGSRLSGGSRVIRGARREFVSRGYNVLLRGALGVRFHDAQCGFKAMRRDVAQQLLPHVEDNAWFFDTELLVIAERAGLRIHEVPVDWIDDEQSSVDVVHTAVDDLKGMVRVARAIGAGRIPLQQIYSEVGRHPLGTPRPPSFLGQLVRFAVVGVVSTIVFALLYVIFAASWPAQVANFLALLVTTIANTAANRRFTFGVRGRSGVVRHQFQGLIVFGMAWAITSGSLVLLHLARPDTGSLAQLIVLTVANLVATALRFVLLRVWVFRRARAGAASDELPTGTPVHAEPPTSRELLLASDRKAA